MSEEWAIDRLRPDPRNREIFDPMEGQQFDDLVKSIRELGILQAILARPDGLIIAGEQRWRGAKVAGLATVPVELREPANDAEMIAMRVAENVQRRQLKPAEMIRAIEAIKAADRPASNILTDGDIGRSLGITGSYVAQLRHILERFPDVIPLMEAGQVPVAVASQLARLSEEDRRQVLDLLKADPKARMTFAGADELRQKLEELDAQLAAITGTLDTERADHAAEIVAFRELVEAAKDEARQEAIQAYRRALAERQRQAAERASKEAKKTFEELLAEVPGGEMARIRIEFLKALRPAREILTFEPAFFVRALLPDELDFLDSYFASLDKWRETIRQERVRGPRLVARAEEG